MKKIFTCPKCKAKIDRLYITQKFEAIIPGIKFDGDDYNFDFEAGYCDLREWLYNMLLESNKKPEILGCEYCIK